MKKILFTLACTACLFMTGKAFAGGIYLNPSAIRLVGVDAAGAVFIELVEAGFINYGAPHWPRQCSEVIDGQTRYNANFSVNTPGGRSMYATILLVRSLGKPSYWDMDTDGPGVACTVTRVLATDQPRNPW